MTAFSAVPCLAAPLILGICGHPLEAAYENLIPASKETVKKQVETQLDLVQQTGLTYYRTGIWGLPSDVAKQNSYGMTNGEKLQLVLQEARARNIKVLPVFTDFYNALYVRGMSPNSKEIDYYNYTKNQAQVWIQKFATQIQYWELGNELESDGMLSTCEYEVGSYRSTPFLWGLPTNGFKSLLLQATSSGQASICPPKSNASMTSCQCLPAYGSSATNPGETPSQYYTPRFNQVRAIIAGWIDGLRTIDPQHQYQLKTLVGTAGWLHYGFLKRLDAELPTLPYRSSKETWDITAWHWYVGVPEKNSKSSIAAKSIQGLKATGLTQPIWITEMNANPSHNLDAKLWDAGESTLGSQAQLLDANLRWFAENAAQYNISAIFVYELLNEPNTPHYGLYDYKNGKAVPRPAAIIYRQFAARQHAQ